MIWSKISRKLHENERIWIQRGVRIPGGPLRSANGNARPRHHTTDVQLLFQFFETSYVIAWKTLCTK